MSRALRILHLEDDPTDAELVRVTLQEAGIGCECTRVERREDFEAALRTREWDLILSDFTLPSYDGMAALVTARALRDDVPFILLSGTLGEEAAVRALLAGATDYVLKERLPRLVPSVQRALREADNRRARRQAELALQASEQRYRRLFETSKDGILLVDAASGRVLDANASLLALLGVAREDLVGEEVATLDLAEAGDGWAAALHDLHTGDDGQYHDVRLQTRDGRYVEVELVGAAYSVGAERVIQWSVRDITARRRLEAELRQAQKMEAFGQLAGGVAHDFNNLLTVIQGNVLLLQRSSRLDADERDMLEEAVAATDRAAGLTRQLLLFSRRRTVQLTTLDLNAVADNLTKMIHRLVGEPIKVEAHFAHGGAPVRADPGMMEQVLMNLAVNARDAMPGGGKLSIETALVEVGPEQVALEPKARPGRFVRLSVRDTGTGIAPQHLPHIFEPFFTTKEVGKGTGLGLATVYGIVEQHAGWVQVDSRPGAGAAFHVFLPALPPGTPCSAVESAERDARRGGTETILLVEDEPAVRSLVRRVLETHGYRVLEAGSGVEALKLFDQRKADIDLLLTDMVMPGGVGGGDLAAQCLAARPAIKVIYSSGYSDDVLGEAWQVRRHAAFLEKPHSPDRILRKVREVLDAP